MDIRTSGNCCINIWDEYDNQFDVFVIFSDYLNDTPMKDGTVQVLKKAYAETAGMASCEEARNHIRKVLKKNGIGYLAVFCREIWEFI